MAAHTSGSCRTNHTARDHVVYRAMLELKVLLNSIEISWKISTRDGHDMKFFHFYSKKRQLNLMVGFL